MGNFSKYFEPAFGNYLIFFAFLQIEKWSQEAGGGIKIIYEKKDKKAPITKTDSTNPYWVAFESAIKEM